jgi:hypothetical protein
MMNQKFSDNFVFLQKTSNETFIYNLLTKKKSVNSDKIFSNSMKGYSANTLLALVFLFVAIFMLQFSLVSYAGNPTDNVSVDVNVTTLSEITVMPAAISWVGVVPGTLGGERNLSIKNTGSTNVSSVYAYVSTMVNESARPYTTDNVAAYSAGGLLVFHNSTNNSYSWAGRMEWNWTEVINNLQTNESKIDPVDSNLTSWGFFRNASTSHVWVIAANSTDGLCNGSGTVFSIEDANDDGSISTRIPNATSITKDGSDDEFAFFSVKRTTNLLNGMCVAVNRTCNNIYVYKYDGRSGFNSCTNFANVAERLVPNQLERLVADIWIPSGLPAGNLTRAWWYFIGS